MIYCSMKLDLVLNFNLESTDLRKGTLDILQLVQQTEEVLLVL